MTRSRNPGPSPASPAGGILYVPHRERVATTNAWAFLHWLRVTRGIDLTGWVELQRFSATTPDDFANALANFAGLSEEPMPLARHAGAREALVLRRGDSSRIAFSRDALLAHLSRPAGEVAARSAAGEGTRESSQPKRAPSPHPELPESIAAPLVRRWPRALLVRPLADFHLFADLRPDDRVLVAGSATWPWLAALTLGTTVILAPPTPLLDAAAQEAATVLIAPGTALAGAAFRQAGARPDLGPLRTIVATGGPLSPPERVRIYTWIKSDLMLLARSGDTVWGNPMEPVLSRPKPAPALTVRPSPRVSARQ